MNLSRSNRIAIVKAGVLAFIIIEMIVLWNLAHPAPKPTTNYYSYTSSSTDSSLTQELAEVYFWLQIVAIGSFCLYKVILEIIRAITAWVNKGVPETETDEEPEEESEAEDCGPECLCEYHTNPEYYDARLGGWTTPCHNPACPSTYHHQDENETFVAEHNMWLDEDERFALTQPVNLIKV